MRALLLLSGLVLAAGCDDPAVRDRIDNVLDHGSVQAEAICLGLTDVVPPNSCTVTNVKVNLLQDGSSIVSLWSASPPQSATTFNSRSSTITGCLPDGKLCAEFVDGDLELSGNGFCDTYPYFKSRVIDVACTGFNLEAFD